MKFPWANTLLIVLIMAELATGLFGLVSGSPDRAIFIQAHRIAGFGILLVLAWKILLVLHSFRRRRRRVSAPRGASVVLSTLLLLALGIGFAWSFAGPFHFAFWSGMSWHTAAGVALLPLLLWHAFYFTRGLRVGYSADRRTALRLVGVAALGIAFWQIGEAVARAAELGGAARRFTGSYQVPQRVQGDFPVVSWLNDRAPPVDLASWRLTVTGEVEHPLSLPYADLAPTSDLTATIDCTGGWYSEQDWRGMPLADILNGAGLTANAESVTVASATGYYRRFSLAEAERYLLATHVGGQPLSPGHGFPVRLVAPGKRGFEWVKWVVSIHVNDDPKWLQPPLPTQ
jgi:DMSO/TMAO reductase YedYZ molybdopterin-dependent catalytic subunit